MVAMAVTMSGIAARTRSLRDAFDDLLRDRVLGAAQLVEQRSPDRALQCHVERAQVLHQTITESEKPRDVAGFGSRCHPDLNRGMVVLQTTALPLGYGTECGASST